MSPRRCSGGDSAAASSKSGSALAANLAKNISQTQTQLKHVKPSCPGQTRYPIQCRFTATQATSGKQVKVAGTISLTGASSSGTYQ